MAEIHLANVWVEFPDKKFGERTSYSALKDISIDLQSGDRLGIIGPNGSGKTTFLRVLTHIYPPTKGEYRSAGTIGSMLSLNAGIDGRISGRDNIMFRSRLLGRSRKLALETVEDACDFGGLKDSIDQPVETYSSGMKMRMAFCIATAFPSQILVMDEWLSVGDKSFREQARGRMRRLVSETEILVLASNKEREIKNMCNQFMLLDNGVAHFEASL